MLYYDNAADAETAVSNAVDAINQKVDLLIEYNAETSANPEIARRMDAVGIPVLAINYPVGNAPLYAADNLSAGRVAGHALGVFAKQSWPDDAPVAVILGPANFIGYGWAAAARRRPVDQIPRPAT
jgi:ABC-type sugar transport system substrate-binding protein